MLGIGIGAVTTVAGAAKSFFSGMTKDARAERKRVREETKALKKQAVKNVATNISSGVAAYNPDILQDAVKLSGSQAPQSGKIMDMVRRYKYPLLIAGAAILLYAMFRGAKGKTRRRASASRLAILAKARAAKRRKAAAR